MAANASRIRLTVDLVPHHHVDTANDPTPSGTAIGLSQALSSNIGDASVITHFVYSPSLLRSLIMTPVQVPLSRRAAAHISPSVSVVPPKNNRSSMLAQFGRWIGAAVGLFRRARWPMEGLMVSDVNVGTRMGDPQTPQSTSAHHNDGSSIIG